jgi:hypothetical protein
MKDGGFFVVLPIKLKDFLAVCFYDCEKVGTNSSDVRKTIYTSPPHAEKI